MKYQERRGANGEVEESVGGVGKDMDEECKKKKKKWRGSLLEALSESEDRTQEKKEGCVLYAAQMRAKQTGR